MCGICGFISTRKMSDETLTKMNDTMIHRGPNDSGCLVVPMNNGCVVGLAHRRLSVIDLSVKGHQPMFSNDQKIIVVFNGEIYNFKKLREELKATYIFQSNCDTEVVIAAYQQWGEECFTRFDGMFAIAIYDVDNEKLVMARDRLGKKPLFYYYKDNTIVFASELKAIMQFDDFKKSVRTDVIGEFLYHRYIQGENTIFESVYKLLPGHILVYQNKKIEKKEYWSVGKSFATQSQIVQKDYTQARQIIKDTIENAVLKRMEADVPIGLFFSGGIDSTIVAAVMQKYSKKAVQTYTIGFNEEGYNEAQYAKEIAEYLGTQHEEKYIDEGMMLQLVKDLPKYFDEPLADPASIPTMLLSSLAQPNATVVLTGDGGDEFFCGYQQYENVEKILKLDKLRAILPNKEILYGKKWTSKLYAIKNNDNDLCKTQWVNGLDASIVDGMLLDNASIELRYLIEDRFVADDWIRKRMLIDTVTTLPDCFLVKTDRATMAYSLEARCPLLDIELLEKTYQLPIEYLKNGNQRKYMLKDILSDYLPKELYERPKKGFMVPIVKWLQGELNWQLKVFTDETRLKKQGIFNAEYINKMIWELERDNKYARIIGSYLWSFFVFQSWYQYNVEDIWNE